MARHSRVSSPTWRHILRGWQVLAELQKDGRFTPEQVADIEAKLAEAAKEMGDDTPTDLLPSE